MIGSHHYVVETKRHQNNAKSDEGNGWSGVLRQLGIIEMHSASVTNKNAAALFCLRRCWTSEFLTLFELNAQPIVRGSEHPSSLFVVVVRCVMVVVQSQEVSTSLAATEARRAVTSGLGG